jgi:hypothetical protein
MSYPGLPFIDTGSLARWTFWGLGLGLACWCAGYGCCAAWRMARSALRRRRADHALRAEAALGLAAIEQFLAAHSASPAAPEPPDGDGGESHQNG